MANQDLIYTPSNASALAASIVADAIRRWIRNHTAAEYDYRLRNDEAFAAACNRL